MPSIIDSALAAAPLILKDDKPSYFMMRENPEIPVSVTLPGSSNFPLTLFNATATGSVKPAGPGTLTLTLYGAPKPSGSEFDWLPLAASVAEPIGGPDDPEETMWMIEGSDLMIFLGSGKLQGTFKSNIASNPQAPLDLDEHPENITNTDPLYVFAIGANFTPDAPVEEGRRRQRKGSRAAGDDADDAETLCTVTVASFTLNA